MRAQYLFVAATAALLAATSAQASVQISADPTQNMNCTGGVCSPTAKNAVLNATDLANMLATVDVKVVTGNRRGDDWNSVAIHLGQHEPADSRCQRKRSTSMRRSWWRARPD